MQLVHELPVAMDTKLSAAFNLAWEDSNGRIQEIETLTQRAEQIESDMRASPTPEIIRRAFQTHDELMTRIGDFRNAR